MMIQPKHCFFFLVIFACHAANAGVVEQGKCIVDIQNLIYGPTGGTDNHGNAVANISTATGITYDLCLRSCGSGTAAFSWPEFSQQFSSWLLPWLALISQLPYGSDMHWENIMSMLLTVGSPTLAAYSLIITLLNGRWAFRRLGHLDFPNSITAARVLHGLQQTPLRMSDNPALLASLVVLPQNDEWWKEFDKALNYTHTWNMSALSSLLWVGIAFTFTVVASFTSMSTETQLFSGLWHGQNVGTSWLWLFPLVIGWLQISPKCNMRRLIAAFTHTNNMAYVATLTGAVSLAEEVSADRAFSLRRHSENPAFVDQERSPPIFNYARIFLWTQAVEQVATVFQQASRNVANHIPVNSSIACQWKTGHKSKEIAPNNRLGSERQVVEYCEVPKHIRHERIQSARWETLCRMLFASILALGFQWGITSAAVVVAWFTPTQGLGCRSGSYILYAILSTLVWFLLLTSSILSSYSKSDDLSCGGNVILSVVLRRAGKIIATINAIWIALSCVLQFAGLYNNCYCRSGVIGLGVKNAYSVMILQASDFIPLKAALAGATVLSGSMVVIFIGLVRLLVDIESQ